MASTTHRRPRPRQRRPALATLGVAAAMAWSAHAAGQEARGGPSPAPPPRAVSAQEVAEQFEEPVPEGFGRFFTWTYWRDWHAGVNLSLSRQPYAGVDARLMPFPVISRLNEYVFTRQKWTVRENLGLWRVVQPSPWEFTLVGGLDPRGYDADDSPALSGLEDRQWTVLGGLGGAWRGDGVYVETQAMTDVLGRSGGQTYILSLGFPRLLMGGRLQLIPHVDAVRESADAVDYYYGITEAEARPGRPAFEGEAATNLRLTTRGSWRFKGRMAIAGRLTWEILDDAITDSPIVERDGFWSVNLSLLVRLGKESDVEQREDSALTGALIDHLGAGPTAPPGFPLPAGLRAAPASRLHAPLTTLPPPGR